MDSIDVKEALSMNSPLVEFQIDSEGKVPIPGQYPDAAIGPATWGGHLGEATPFSPMLP